MELIGLLFTLLCMGEILSWLMIILWLFIQATIIKASAKLMSSPKVILKKPWMTRALLTSCNKKNKLYLNYKKHPTSNNKAEYLKYRNKFKELKLAAEKIYYEHEFSRYSQDSKKTWRIIKSLINGQS